jgi:hypothetical protein
MELSNEVVLNEDGDIRVTAVLENEYIGCTYTEDDGQSYEYGTACESGTCLGGNQNQFCNFPGLSFIDPEDPNTFLTYYETGDSLFNLSIGLNNAQGLDIESIMFALEYDSAAIDFELDALDILTDNNNYNILYDESTPGKLVVSVYANNVVNIPDNQELFILSGIGTDLGETEISFSYIEINENEASFGEGIKIMFKSLFYAVKGSIKYYKYDRAVPEVNIYGNLSEDVISPSFDASTNDVGDFSYEQAEVEIEDENYKVQVSRASKLDVENSYFDGLSALDASRIQRYWLNSYNFETEEELLAANVNLDYRCKNMDDNSFDLSYDNKEACESNEGFKFEPNISPHDAVLVARYAAGISQSLNQDSDEAELCNPNWMFIDSLRSTMMINNNDGKCNEVYSEGVFNDSYSLTLESDTNLVFKGIRLGDVSGNWKVSEGLNRELENFEFDTPIVDAKLHEIISLPIYLPNEREIEGIDLKVQFDPTIFNLLGFSDRNGIIDNSIYKTIINKQVAGEFQMVSYAGNTPIKTNGLIGSLKFEVIGNSEPNSTIIIEELEINEIAEGGFLIQHGSDIGGVALGYQFNFKSIPGEFALNQNFPNPFNPSTNIQFDLPENGEVKISIFDIKGCLVEELLNSYLDAGYHNLKWNASGQASGMYFIQMIADNGQYIKMTKMTLMK